MPVVRSPDPPELTAKAVILGILLALVFGSANAWLGMKAGQTVAATIPAAVIAMAIFRLPVWGLRGGILEQNIARTAASVGEALVAGAIFTIPAFILVDVGGSRLWSDLRTHYWEASLILLAGGLLGVFFIILLRQPLCVDAGLPWPESVASVEIVKAGDHAGSAPRTIFGAMGVGALIQVLKSERGLQILRDYVEGYWAFPRSLIRHFNFERRPIAEVAHAGGIAWATPSLSPALLGVGYIIGPRFASINVAGGIIAWWLLIPLLLFFDPDLPARLGNPSPEVAAYTVWYNIVRPIAVGTMLVAAFYTLYSMRDSILRSLRGALSAASALGPGKVSDRTERDIPLNWVVGAIGGLLIPIAALYYHFTRSWTATLLATAVMTLAGFLLSAVGGYLVGLVGSSNQPVSGLTLSALVLAAVVLLAAGIKDAPGMAGVLGVAAVVCCACCVSGSLIQDLKAGHLLGGTPWKMQLVEILAVVVLSLFLMLPIIVLHEANLAAGGIGGRALPAPQAGLMAQLAKGIMGGQMAWGLLGIGAAFGIALILCGARAPMLVAVGMYLPFDTSSAIFAGGLLKAVLERFSASKPPDMRHAIEQEGTLLASGLIAGEAVMGILLAVSYVGGMPSLTRLLTGRESSDVYSHLGGWLSLLVFLFLAWVLIWLPLGKASKGPATG